MASRNRRSMGTKVGLQPQRISLNSQSEHPDSATKGGRFAVPHVAASSGSRIPRPGSSQRPGRNPAGNPARGRSSSSCSASGNAFVTPNYRSRSSSSQRKSSSSAAAAGSAAHPAAMMKTPQRVLQPHNANRFSMTGRKSSVGGKAAVRDARQLTDRDFQVAATEDVIRFLAEAGYEKVLGRADFPVGSGEFKNIFEFLTGFIIPDYEVPRKGFETALPELLRNKLSYPLQVSKSTFQTLGTKHSWPHVLGVLHYLCGRASRCLRRSADPQGEGAGEIVDIVFPCTDEHGFSTDSATSDDNIFFQTWKACYASFNRGHDEHSNELEVLQFKLEANHRINREELKRLERDRHACRRDLSHLQKEPGRYEALAKQYRDLKDDLGKTKKYSEQSRAYADRKAADDEEMQAKIVELEACKETSQEALVQAKALAESRGAGRMGAAESTQQELRMEDLRHQLEFHRDSNSSAEKRSWSKELACKKHQDRLETQAKAYNGNLQQTNADAEAAASLQLEWSSNPQDLLLPQQKLLLESRKEERAVVEEQEERQEALKVQEVNLRKFRAEEERLSAESHELKDRLVSAQLRWEEEDRAVSERIQESKASLMDMKGKRNDDLEKEKARAEEAEEHLESEWAKADKEVNRAIDLATEAFHKAESFIARKEEEVKEEEEVYQSTLEKRKEDCAAFQNFCDEIVQKMNSDLE